jgi:Bardet-Biedl syndrome 1 protein
VHLYFSIQVAAGQYIFIYRQLRPYKKWTCPQVELSQEEIELWGNLRGEGLSIENAIERLREMRDSGCVLSARSLELISLESEEKRLLFVDEMKEIELTQWTCITCMDILKRDNEENDAVSLLVVGTENKQLLILPEDPSGSVCRCKVNLPSVPVLLTISGAFDVEWRIVVACRDGKIYRYLFSFPYIAFRAAVALHLFCLFVCVCETIALNFYSVKNGDIRGTAVLTGTVIDPGASQIVSMQIAEKNIWVACTDRSLTCYSFRGKRSLGIILQEDILDLTLISVRRAKVANCLLVALGNGEIRM